MAINMKWNKILSLTTSMLGVSHPEPLRHRGPKKNVDFHVHMCLKSTSTSRGKDETNTHTHIYMYPTEGHKSTMVRGLWVTLGP